MQVSDFRSLGTARKGIYGDAGIGMEYTATNKNGCLLYVLNDIVTATLFLRFDISGEDTANYGTLSLSAGIFIPGVKSFLLTSGNVLVIE